MHLCFLAGGAEAAHRTRAIDAERTDRCARAGWRRKLAPEDHYRNRILPSTVAAVAPTIERLICRTVIGRNGRRIHLGDMASCAVVPWLLVLVCGGDVE